MNRLIQGPGFPLTRKRVVGFSETFIIAALLSLLGVWLGLDSVEFEEIFEFLKGLNALSVS